MYYYIGNMEKRNGTALLIAQNGLLNSKQWLIEQEMVIGRDPTCEVAIDDRQISRRHARIFFMDGTFYIEDLQSKNGTYINHNRIYEITRLNEGDVIQIALIQEFLYISSDATIPLSEAQVYRMLYIDNENGSVWIKEQKVDPPLSIQQFTLLKCFYENMGNIVTRSEIVERVWAESSGEGISNEAIDALVRRLRYRLAEIEKDFEFIETVRGYGFRFNNPVR